MPRIIWSQPGNPTRSVSDRLGIHHWQLGKAIHEIKAAGKLRAPDRVIIYDDGMVTDERVSTSATSTTNSDKTISAFATLRFVGDALDPDQISEALKQKPKRAYRKGETYRPGPRSPELIGKTGLWYFSTDRVIPSKDLSDHLDALIRLIAPFADDGKRLQTLREIMERENLEAHVTCFWRGFPGAEKPSIPSVATEAFARLGAGFETDFDTEDEPPRC